jgi:UDP-N-acetylglucosamine 1-carboxyvinyltransferase
LSSHGLTSTRADYDIVRKMRASNLVLGPLLAREGQAVVSLPGGCAIGARPMDIHIDALERLGATIELRDGYLHATTSGGLKGNRVPLRFASVGATENVLMAATLAKGTSIIENAAREPEIVDLARCLRAMGAQIQGEGTSTITIQGVDRLNGATHQVVTDRIELGTYMLAPPSPAARWSAWAGGSSSSAPSPRSCTRPASRWRRPARLKVAAPTPPPRGRRGDRALPGFPTDLQAQMMACSARPTGTLVLEERIFENRFMHAPELPHGARIECAAAPPR